MIEHGDQAAARLYDTKHLINHRPWIRNVVQNAHRADDVKMIVRKRQVVAVHFLELTGKPSKGKAFSAELDGRARQVDACDLRAMPRILIQDVAIPASDIENAQAFRRRD